MEDTNELYPIFLKASQLHVLIVGGGNVGLEKLSFLLKSSPNAKVTVVAKQFLPEIKELAANYDVRLVPGAYTEGLLNGKQWVIAATENAKVNHTVYMHAKARNILINVADTPELCDFYLGGIVTKGDLKLAISTNGQSPTLAKRLRQFFEQVLPNDINHLAENLHTYRNSIGGNFQQKVTELNKLTQSLVTEN